MINCPECGAEISDKAKKCIHCGKVLIEEKASIKVCSECGKEAPADATECPYCGCPYDEHVPKEVSVSVEQAANGQPKKKKRIKIIIPIVAVIAIIAVAVGGYVYNVKVVQPEKIEAQNKEIYDEAVGLLEQGKYEEGNELFQTIAEYKDVDTIMEQIKWESRVYECISDMRNYLKNPDSLQIYEVDFYYGYNDKYETYNDSVKEAMKPLIALTNEEPVCVIREGAQNGFGGNSTGYALFICSDGSYKYMGNCDTLDEDEVDDDDKTVCQLINIYKDNLEVVGDIDLTRLKTIVKNDSYSTIKIIK
jgi:ribosomal protein L40E